MCPRTSSRLTATVCEVMRTRRTTRPVNIVRSQIADGSSWNGNRFWVGYKSTG